MANIGVRPAKKPKLVKGKRQQRYHKLKPKNPEVTIFEQETITIDLEEVPSFVQNQSREIEVPYREDGKVINNSWESKPRFITATSPHYKYSLVVRPNGLRCTDGYGKAIGIWFRPLPSNDTTWPAKVKLSISILDRGGNVVLTTDQKDFEWVEEQTMSPYPTSKFDLMAFKHCEVEQKNCVDNEGSVTIILNEH